MNNLWQYLKEVQELVMAGNMILLKLINKSLDQRLIKLKVNLKIKLKEFPFKKAEVLEFLI